MYYTDDPVRDAERHAEELDKRLGSLPICDTCGEAIQESYCYQVHHELICPHCMKNYYRVWTDEIAEGWGCNRWA